MDYFPLPRWSRFVLPTETILERLQDAVARIVYVTDPDRDDALLHARAMYRDACATGWCKTGHIEFDSPMVVEEGRAFESGVYAICGHTTERLREAMPLVRAGWAWDTQEARVCEVRTTNHWLGVLCSGVILPETVSTIRALPSPTFAYLKGALVHSRLLKTERTRFGGYVTDWAALRAAYPDRPMPPNA